MTAGAYLMVVFVPAVHLPICAFVAVIDGIVSFRAGIVSFQVKQTLAVVAGAVVLWTEETIWDGTCREI